MDRSVVIPENLYLKMN